MDSLESKDLDAGDLSAILGSRSEGVRRRQEEKSVWRVCRQPGSSPRDSMPPRTVQLRRGDLRESLSRQNRKELSQQLKPEMHCGDMSRDTKGVCDSHPPSGWYTWDETSSPQLQPSARSLPNVWLSSLKSGQPPHQPTLGPALL